MSGFFNGHLNLRKTPHFFCLFHILLISSYRIADYVLSDDQTLTRLIGSLATNVVKVGIATVAGTAAGTFVAGITTLVGFGPH